MVFRICRLKDGVLEDGVLENGIRQAGATARVPMARAAPALPSGLP
jgi:hypothetical protein